MTWRYFYHFFLMQTTHEAFAGQTCRCCKEGNFLMVGGQHCTVVSILALRPLGYAFDSKRSQNYFRG